MPMGMADVATVLFTKFMRLDAKAPSWADRDRFILSAGHGSMLIYSLAYLLGYDDIDLEDLKNFRQLGFKTAGHPEFGHAPGVETTTGPLGQGISNAVGFAMAEAHLNALYGDDLVDHYTYVIAGDGCLMEGNQPGSNGACWTSSVTQAHRPFGMTMKITIDGAVSLADSTNQLDRAQASGWNTLRVDGHDPAKIEEAIRTAQSSTKPTLIACKTTIGKGAPNKGGTAKAHGAPLGEEEIGLTREALGWPHGPFEIPSDILSAWRDAGARGVDGRELWERRLATHPQTRGFHAPTERR